MVPTPYPYLRARPARPAPPAPGLPAPWPHPPLPTTQVDKGRMYKKCVSLTRIL
jgi:hypothetical protein